MSDRVIEAAPRPDAETFTPQRPLLANAFYAITGHAFYHICQLGVVVLLNKFASAEIAGQYFLGLAIASPIVQFFGLELRGAFVADAGSQFTYGTYRMLRRYMMLPAMLLLAACFVWQATLDARLSFLAILAGVFAAKITWSLAEVGWGTYQRRERLDLLAATVGLRGLALIIPFAAVLPVYYFVLGEARLAEGTAIAVVLHALGAIAVLMLFDRPHVNDPRHWDLSWSWPAIRELAWQTLPLGVVALVIHLCDTYPRLVLEMDEQQGKTLLGYFGSMAYITLAGNLIVIQAAAAAANRLAVYYQRNLRRFLRLGALLTVGALGLGAVILLVVIFFGRWILRVLYTPDYATYEAEFQVIVFAHCIALLTNVFGTLTTQMRLFWVQVPVQLITLGSTVVAAILLIPGPTPVMGAAQTVFIRAVVQFCLYALCVGLGLLLRDHILRRNGRRTGLRPGSPLAAPA